LPARTVNKTQRDMNNSIAKCNTVAQLGRRQP